MRHNLNLAASLIEVDNVLNSESTSISAIYKSAVLPQGVLSDCIKRRLDKGLRLDVEDTAELIKQALENKDDAMLEFLLAISNKLNPKVWEKWSKWLIVQNRFDLKKKVASKMASQENIDQIDENGQTKLMKAAELGDIDQVAKLLVLGADVNKQDGKGNTALHLASSGLHTEVVNLLLKQNNIKVGVANKAGDHALRVALKAGLERNQNHMDGLNAAKSVIELLQGHSAGHSFGSRDIYFPDKSFRNVLNREFSNFLSNAAVTWVLSAAINLAAFAVTCIIASYSLPAGLILSPVCVIAIRYTGDALIAAKAFYDAKDPVTKLVSTALQNVMDSPKKLNLEGKFLIGQVHANWYGKVTTGAEYRDILTKHSAYKNASQAFYTVADLPRSQDGSLNLSARQQVELQQSLVRAYGNLKEQYENTLLEHKRIKLAEAMKEVREAYGLIAIGANLEGLNQGLNKAFRAENVGYLAAEIAQNRVYRNTFYNLYRRVCSGAVKIGLEERYHMERVHQAVQNNNTVSTGNPSINAQSFFTGCLTYKHSTLKFHQVLKFVDMVHASSLENVEADRSMMERASQAVSVASSVGGAVVRGGVNVVTTVAGVNEQRVVNGVGSAVGTVAGVANGLLNVVARRNLSDGQLAAAAVGVVAVKAVHTYPQQARLALRMAACTALNTVRFAANSVCNVAHCFSAVGKAVNSTFRSNVISSRAKTAAVAMSIAAK